MTALLVLFGLIIFYLVYAFLRNELLGNLLEDAGYSGSDYVRFIFLRPLTWEVDFSHEEKNELAGKLPKDKETDRP